MKIKFMRKVEGTGKTRAFFSVEWENRLVIHDCRLVENERGIFIMFPFRTYQDRGQTKFQTIVEVDQELLTEISKLARYEYERL